MPRAFPCSGIRHFVVGSREERVGTHHSRIAELSFNLVEAAMAVKASVKGKRKSPFQLISELQDRVSMLELKVFHVKQEEVVDDVPFGKHAEDDDASSNS